MTIDSDVIFLKKFDVFSENKPVLWYLSFARFTGYDEMLSFWGLKKILNRSMICHMMMFHKAYCYELVDRFIELNSKPKGLSRKEHLYYWMIENQNETFRFSEFETYSNFVSFFHPVKYVERELSGADTSMDKVLIVSDTLKILDELKTVYKDISCVAIHSRI